MFKSSDKTEPGIEKQLDALQESAGPVPTQQKNIDQLQKELEYKNILLSLSKDIASIRAKEDLNALIKTKFGKLFYFYHCTICTLSEDKVSLRAFLLDPNSKVKKHNDYNNLITDTFPIANGIDNIIINSDHAVFFDFDQLEEMGTLPPQGKVIYESGIREMIGCRLMKENEVFGFVDFFSDTKGQFTEDNFWLVESIASLIAPAVANILAQEEIENRVKERETMLALSNDIARVKDRAGLMDIIQNKLRSLFSFSHSLALKCSDDLSYLTTFLLDPHSQSRADPNYEHIVSQRVPVKDGFLNLVLDAQNSVIVDIEKEALRDNAPAYMKMHFNTGLHHGIALALRSADQRPIGVLAFYSDRKEHFDRRIAGLLERISYHLSTALSNVLFNEDIKERDKEKMVLLNLSQRMAQIRNQGDLLEVMRLELKKLFYFSYSNIVLLSEDQRYLRAFLADPASTLKNHPNYESFVKSNHPIEHFPRLVIQSEKPVYMNLEEMALFGQIPNVLKMHYEVGIREVVAVALRNENEVFGILNFYSDRINFFTANHLDIIEGVSNQVATAVSNIIANEKIAQQLEEIKSYKEQLEEENLYLQQEAGGGYSYDDIVGFGPEMQKVFRLLSQVAFADSTVLVLGETGTGKELVARALHNSSPRKEKLLVKVNCAALPASLIESELFGHEKGSFTGATERRIGKFELANHGTLFLDEIGEMPLDLQVKLLRAIQEKEIERVGGKSTIKIDVRIIAATNRNLQREVDEGRFRRDLFYRINVFPIILPPLRERRNDIPALVSHFIEKYARNTGKKISNISAKAMKELMDYDWPGNVRELEHLIERNILVTKNNTLNDMNLPVKRIAETEMFVEPVQPLKTFEENERDYIIEVINSCDGKLSGPGGAAEILDLNISTLNHKIKKLGISKEKGLYSKG